MLQLVAALLLVTSLGTDARLTHHFVEWLKDNGYESYDFQRDDIGGLSFGGKMDENDKPVNQPVVMIHGLSGSTHHYNKTRDHFLDSGYEDSEVYGTTWGHYVEHGVDNMTYLSKGNIMHVRKFIEAVLLYTGAEKIDVIAHSMGVLMTRLSIKGGQNWDEGFFDVGEPLTSRIDTYVGVAGPNQGVAFCIETFPYWKLCNPINGMFPGRMEGHHVVGQSETIANLNKARRFEGTHIFSILSTFDEVFGNGGLLYCRYPNHVPGSDFDIKFEDPSLNHMTVLFDTAEVQLQLVRNQDVSTDYKPLVVRNPA